MTVNLKIEETTLEGVLHKQNKTQTRPVGTNHPLVGQKAKILHYIEWSDQGFYEGAKYVGAIGVIKQVWPYTIPKNDPNSWIVNDKTRHGFEASIEFLDGVIKSFDDHEIEVLEG